eukprot:scaffold304676_cov21-Tisochrysis_lutea.AAC.1
MVPTVTPFLLTLSGLPAAPQAGIKHPELRLCDRFHGLSRVAALCYYQGSNCLIHAQPGRKSDRAW